MEAFTDAVRLRALGLGARVIDILDREIQLVLVPFGVAAEAPCIGSDIGELEELSPCVCPAQCGRNRSLRARGIVEFIIPASLIGRSGSSAFRLSTHYSVDVAHGLVLLYGIGTKALPSWDSRTRRNNL